MWRPDVLWRGGGHQRSRVQRDYRERPLILSLLPAAGVWRPSPAKWLACLGESITIQGLVASDADGACPWSEQGISPETLPSVAAFGSSQIPPAGAVGVATTGGEATGELEVAHAAGLYIGTMKSTFSVR